MSQPESKTYDAKELAFLYDLYVVPQWRETFDRLVDEELTLPEAGKWLEVECGTGGYAVDLALKGGTKVEVVGVDSSAERLALARGKAEVKKAERVTFQTGVPTALDFPSESFDLVLADASLLPAASVGEILVELTRVAKKGATVLLKLASRGSFDEFFSLYWEALYNLGLLEYVPQMEALITERLLLSDAEQLAKDAGLKRVHNVTRKERFDFADGQTFISAPLIETFFLGEWLAAFPDAATRESVKRELISLIERERQERDFDVSIKATLLVGQK